MWMKKVYELFCIENDFAKYFAECRNSFKYFVLHIMVIAWNDTYLYYRTNQISFCFIILGSAFLAPE